VGNIGRVKYRHKGGDDARAAVSMRGRREKREIAKKIVRVTRR
jgi:hypothetical protein